MISYAAIVSFNGASGPPHAIHPSFACGNPQDFDIPPSAQVTTSS